MSDALAQYTPERWEAAKTVLSGDSDEGVSMKAAARAAGVSAYTLKAWIARSRERNPDDDPSVYEIAEFYDTIDELQASRLEDDVWALAKKGKKKNIRDKKTGEILDTEYEKDAGLMMKLLKVRDEKYQDRPKAGPNINLDASEIFRRMIAGKRIAEAECQALEAKQNAQGAFQVNE